MNNDTPRRSTEPPIPQPNQFALGCLYAIPRAVLLWTIILTGLYLLSLIIPK